MARLRSLFSLVQFREHLRERTHQPFPNLSPRCKFLWRTAICIDVLYRLFYRTLKQNKFFDLAISCLVANVLIWNPR